VINDDILDEIKSFMEKGYPIRKIIRECNIVPIDTTVETIMEKFIEKFGREELRRIRNECTFPPIKQQAKSVAGAVGRLARNIFNLENPKANKEIIVERRKMCAICDQAVPDIVRINVIQCARCKCYISLKTLLRDETCPLGKW
jgi:hypothetical protein